MTRDLRTGQDRPHRREDYNTKITAVAADERVPIPLWSQFLDRVTAQDKELHEIQADHRRQPQTLVAQCQ
jgi:phage/plasmid-associated DNA primase